MIRTRYGAVAVFVLLLVGAFPASAAGKKSEFQRLSKQIGAIIKLTLSENVLILDRSSWGDDDAAGGQLAAGGARAIARGMALRLRVAAGGGQASGIDDLFRKLGQVAGSHGFSTSSSNNSRLRSFEGGSLAGTLTTTGKRVQITLHETNDPGNDLTVSDDAQRGLRLSFTNRRGDLLMIAQNANGRVTVAHVAPGVQFTGTEPSFAAFHRKHTAYVENRLLPFLSGLGIRTFPSRLSPAVVRAVLARLRPPDATARAAFRKRLAGLDDADFGRREAATKALSKAAADCWPLIVAALKAPPSEEVKTRLTDVYSSHPELQEVDSVVGSLGLLDDAPYLAELQKRLKGADAATVAARLKTLADKSTKQEN